MEFYIEWDYDTLTDGVQTGTETVRLAYTGLTCSEEEALFDGLTEQQIRDLRATMSTAVPSIPTGYHGPAVSRNCGPASVLVVLGGNTDIVLDPSNIPPVTTGSGFDNSYTFSRSGSDYTGQTFVTSPAPSLTAVDQAKPRLLGNYYAFTPQSALCAALFKRIPKHTTHASKILIYPGGLYSDASDNDLMGRGWTHLSESTSFNGAATPNNYKRALELANYAAAYNAAMSLPDSDPRKQPLLDWAGPLPAFEGRHIFLNRKDAAQLYAQFWYQTFKDPTLMGAGVEYFSVNHEINEARNPDAYYQEWYTHIGWISQAIIDEAAADGKTLKTGMTDWGNLSHRSPFFFDDNDSATGYPRYMSVGYVEEPYRGGSQASPLGNGNDMSNMLLAGTAFVGVGRYMQHTMDEQSLFEKDANGNILVTGGLAVYRKDKRYAAITGQQTVIYKDDNERAMLKRYSYEASDYTNWFLRAGSKHLPMSTDRGAGYGNIRFSAQFRLDTESDTSNPNLGAGYEGLTSADFHVLNERPLNPDWTEGNAIRMYLNSDYVRGWMDTQPMIGLGQDNGKGSKARASVEIYAKGFQRAANLNWIFDTPYQLIEPKLWLKNQGIVSARNPDEEFYRKPILRGGHGLYNSKRTIWMRGEWPLQDVGKTTDVSVWVDTGSVQSPAYTIRLDGRKTYLDYWALPDGFPAFESKHVYFQFNSLLGEKITWRGDYREAKITNHPTPPAAA